MVVWKYGEMRIYVRDVSSASVTEILFRALWFLQCMSSHASSCLALIWYHLSWNNLRHLPSSQLLSIDNIAILIYFLSFNHESMFTFKLATGTISPTKYKVWEVSGMRNISFPSLAKSMCFLDNQGCLSSLVLRESSEPWQCSIPSPVALA